MLDWLEHTLRATDPDSSPPFCPEMLHGVFRSSPITTLDGTEFNFLCKLLHHSIMTNSPPPRKPGLSGKLYVFL